VETEFSFKITIEDRVLYLLADGEYACENWIAILKESTRGPISKHIKKAFFDGILLKKSKKGDDINDFKERYCCIDTGIFYVFESETVILI
jgi:hypothetical protein